MANEQNLKPYKKGELSSEEAKKRGRAGGKKSVEVRRERKKFREDLIAALETGNTQKNIIGALLIKAAQGDTKAFEVIRDTIGEKPVDNVNMTGDLGLEIVVDYGDSDETGEGAVQ